MMQFVEQYETPELIINYVAGRTDYSQYEIKELPEARVFQVREGSSWAIAIVRSWTEGGSIDIQSDYGSYSYIWHCIGEQDIYSFLCSLDFQYFMKKTCPDYQIFDQESSIEAIKEYIIEGRRSMSFEKEAARSLWNELEWLDFVDDESGFYEKVCSLEHITDVFPDLDIPLYEKPAFHHKLFWNGPWQALSDHWKQGGSC